MAGTEDIAEGKWNQLKGKVRQQWGDMTDDDIARIGGRKDEFVGVMQERYGKSKAEAEKDFNDFRSQNA